MNRLQSLLISSLGISEIETGLDGNLYILTFDRETEGLGSLYRVLPAAEAATTTVGAPPLYLRTPLLLQLLMRMKSKLKIKMHKRMR